MAVAGDGIGAASRIDANFGPDHTGANLDGRYLRDRDALVSRPEQTRLDPADVKRADNDAGGKDEIASRPATGLEGFAGRGLISWLRCHD